MAQPLSEIFEQCQRRFPTVQLPIDKYQSRIEEILASETRPAGDEVKIHYEDLFLAIACAQGDRVAWEHFTDDYVPLLKTFAAQACGSSSEGQDLAQETVAKLLNEKDRLAGYNGRGSLAGWLRVAISHAAIDRFRRKKRWTSLDSLEEKEMEALLQPSQKAQDEEPLDSRWGPVVSKIAEDQLRALPVRDRLLLNFYYLRGVPLKDIARHYGVHEATASRRLERLRSEIRKEIERTLRKQHGLRSSEIHSLWKWISPQTLAESIRNDMPEIDPARQQGSPSHKKSAMGESRGVINKEEVR